MEPTYVKHRKEKEAAKNFVMDLKIEGGGLHL